MAPRLSLIGAAAVGHRADAYDFAALDALQGHGIVPREFSVYAALAHPLYGRLVRMHAGALARGERPYPPPPHVRPSVIAPAAEVHSIDQQAHAAHWASPPWYRRTTPFDAKAAAAGVEKGN